VKGVNAVHKPLEESLKVEEASVYADTHAWRRMQKRSYAELPEIATSKPIASNHGMVNMFVSIGG
jgi:hypothetical protein